MRSAEVPVATWKVATVEFNPEVDTRGLVLPSLKGPHRPTSQPSPVAKSTMSLQRRGSSGQPSDAAIGCGIAITCGLVAIDGASTSTIGLLDVERSIRTHEVAAGDHTVGNRSCPISSNALPEGSALITTSIGTAADRG